MNAIKPVQKPTHRITVEVELTDTELEAINYIGQLLAETQQEAIQDFVTTGIESYLHSEELGGLPRTRQLIDALKAEEVNKA